MVRIMIFMLCLFSCITVDDDNDDLTSISRIMNILYIKMYHSLNTLSWSVVSEVDNDDGDIMIMMP